MRWNKELSKKKYPLQLIRAPMAPDSRQLKPVQNAIPPHATNFDVKATTQMMTIYAQDKPVLSKPRFVLNPDKTKYCQDMRSLMSPSFSAAGTYNWQEDNCDQILKFFHNRNSVPIVVGNNQPSQKPTCSKGKLY